MLKYLHPGLCTTIMQSVSDLSFLSALLYICTIERGVPCLKNPVSKTFFLQEQQIKVTPFYSILLSARALDQRADGFTVTTVLSHSCCPSLQQHFGGLKINPALFVVLLVCADIWINTPKWKRWVEPTWGTLHSVPVPQVLRPITGQGPSSHRCIYTSRRPPTTNKQIRRDRRKKGIGFHLIAHSKILASVLGVNCVKIWISKLWRSAKTAHVKVCTVR